jgi:glycosyltransferase involved in cell wall biosynthesis
MKPVEQRLDILAVIIDVGLMLENSAVFQSQVGDKLIALKRQGYSAGLLAVSREFHSFESAIGTRMRAAGIQIYLVKDGGFLRNILRMAGSLLKLQTEVNVGTAYVRGLWGPVVLGITRPFRKLDYIYDVRGSIGDESLAIGMHKLKRALYLAIETWGIRGSSGTTAVTRFLAKSTSARIENRAVRIIPCNVDSEKFAVTDEQIRSTREAMGFSPDEIIFVYSGGLSHYQQVPAMLKLWRKFLDEPDVRFLLLTNDDPHSKPLVVGEISDFGEKLQCRSLPRSEVITVLGSASIGFMLRDSRELNQAASPVKFSEYIAAGLAVVASPGTGDISDDVIAHRVGILIEPSNIDEGEGLLKSLLVDFRKDGPNFRVRSSSLAKAKYDWQAYESVFRSLYQKA